MRLIVIILLLGTIASLAYAASGLLRSRTDRRAGAASPVSSDRLQRALRLRIGFSVALFLLLLLAWQAGLIEPHGLGG